MKCFAAANKNSAPCSLHNGPALLVAPVWFPEVIQ